MSVTSIPGCNPSPLLEATEHDFYARAFFIKVFIMGNIYFPVRFRRDKRLNIQTMQRFSNAVRIVCFICLQFFHSVNIFLMSSFPVLQSLIWLGERQKSIGFCSIFAIMCIFVFLPPLARPIGLGSPSDLRLQAGRCALAKVESIATILLFPSLPGER